MDEFARVIEERRTAILALVARIEGGGTGSEVDALRSALVQLSLAIRRHPGIELASEDLHAAATALVGVDDGSSDLARRRRMLREAADRLVERLETARPAE